MTEEELKNKLLEIADNKSNSRFLEARKLLVDCYFSGTMPLTEFKIEGQLLLEKLKEEGK